MFKYSQECSGINLSLAPPPPVKMCCKDALLTKLEIGEIKCQYI